ncbi:MAG TPA: ATP-dependent DNA helicase [Egibacteraceae bacterium]|nr:ATP-dependent DNA helicase [Egibacteraceae bacterium]
MPVHPLDALDAILSAHPGASRRPGQEAMCAAVAQAVAERRHLLVEAGTGVGKSFAYLAVAATLGRRVVVATATKALQEQLVGKDLPAVADALEPLLGRRLRFAMLKGRGNYLCLAKAASASRAMAGLDDTLLADLPSRADDEDAVAQLAWWAWQTETGDQAEVPFELKPAQWRHVSTDARECPGAGDCAFGEECFAERARRQAMSADIVVVNTHLYTLHAMLEAEGAGLLPPHDLVIVDEAHTLEDIAVGAFSVEVSGVRLRWLAGRVRAIVDGGKADAALQRAADGLDVALGPLRGERVDPADGSLGAALAATSKAALAAVEELSGIAPTSEDAVTRHRMAMRAAESLVTDLAVARAAGAGEVAWVKDSGALAVSPVEVGPALADTLFSRRTAVLTSATLGIGGSFEPRAFRLGLGEERPLTPADDGRGAWPPEAAVDEDGEPEPHTLEWSGLAVESPFDYQASTLLYCAVDLPEPNSDAFRDAATRRLAELMRAAGGRTLALFTSHAALRHAAEALPGMVDFPLLVQDEAPRGLLMERFVAEEEACLLATLGFWQGVDVPGRSLSLVVVDRLPFPHRNDPLMQARRELATARRRSAFMEVDLPHAATLLAQGVGRLIRSSADRGAVAVLDRRLATKDSYRPTLLRSLPPMPRTRELSEAVAFLEHCVTAAAGMPAGGARGAAGARG